MNLPPLYALLIVLGCLFFLTLLVRRSLLHPRPRAEGETPADLLPSPASPQVRRNLEELLVEVHDTTREMNARMDTKMRFLQQLLADADQRIATLEKLTRPAPGNTVRSPEPAPSLVPPAISAVPASAPAATYIAHTYAASSPRTAPLPPPVPPLRQRQELHDRILAEHRQGRPPLEIARTVGLPIGEVELILNLKRQAY